MSRRVWISLAISAVIVTITGSMWALRPQTAPEVAELRRLTERLFDTEDVTEDETRQIVQRLREIKENVPKGQRGNVYKEMEVAFQSEMNAHFRRFAAVPEESRDSFLDRDIDRMAGMKNIWKDDQRKGRRRSTDASAVSKKSGKKRQLTVDQRKARRRQRLDKRSAEDRAYAIEYKQALKQRLLERGIKAFVGKR